MTSREREPHDGPHSEITSATPLPGCAATLPTSEGGRPVGSSGQHHCGGRDSAHRRPGQLRQVRRRGWAGDTGGCGPNRHGHHGVRGPPSARYRQPRHRSCSRCSGRVGAVSRVRSGEHGHLVACGVVPAGVLVEIFTAMVLLSRVLPYRANRWTNIADGTVMTAVDVTFAHTDRRGRPVPNACHSRSGRGMIADGGGWHIHAVRPTTSSGHHRPDLPRPDGPS